MADSREPSSGEVLPAYLRAMLKPSFYAAEPGGVELIQTHISYVLLVGDEVYKLKKPVRFSFLDFSQLERRLHYCREEVRLNRRLAPDVYLGVVSIVPTGTGYRFGEEDDPEAIEYAVRMRRLPEERMFSEILGRGEAREEHVDAIARCLAEFHANADAGPEVAANGSPEALLAVMDRDFSESDRYRGRTITPGDDVAIQSFCRGFVERHESTLRARQEGGRIRECHGDLRAEHICFADQLAVIDCIEFESRFRNRDVAAEMAFLAMDIEHLGHRALARRLIERYAEISGDPGLARLVPYYQCYFAYIRGKVESLASQEVEVGDAGRERAAASAEGHFAQAYRYTWAYTPALVAVVGRSGSGKSTVASALHDRIGFAHFNSDVVRKQLAGLPTDRRAPADSKERLYSSEMSRRTYEKMLDLAEEELRSGRGVIVDATFQRESHRRPVYDLARQRSVPVLFVECECAEREIERRLGARSRSGLGPSDADWSIFQAQTRNYEGFAAEEREHRLGVSTDGEMDDVVARIEEALRLAQ